MSKVSLNVYGMKAVLDNGLLHVEINERGSVSSLIKGKEELVKNLCGADNDVNNKRTFYLDYHVNGKFRDFNPSILKIIKDEEDFVHIAYIDNDSIIKAQYHMIMVSGISGLYSYVIAGNNTEDDIEISELRTVYRMGKDNFNMAYNAERTGYQPSHIELEKEEKIQDETFKYKDGYVYSKYDYAGYFKENKLWGEYGDKFGAWFIPVSKEYYPGGPLKQELLVHYDGIILNYMTGAHFGSGPFIAPQDWEKLYGPWLFYINENDTTKSINQESDCEKAQKHNSLNQDCKGNDTSNIMDDFKIKDKENFLICDAVSRAKEEEKKWPYKWMKEKMYPLERAEVSGEIVSEKGAAVKKPVAVLAHEDENGEFLRQKDSYIYYADCDDEGKFKIKNVRPGLYSLYAYATYGRKTRQLEKDEIKIKAGQNDLGKVRWEVPQFNNLLWQIGKSDRKTTGFKYSSEQRNYKWMTMLPRELTFEIGKNNEHTDWYYAQPKDSTWNIKFKLDREFSGKAHLTIALAGATTYVIGVKKKPVLMVEVNGRTVKKAEYENDTTVYRSALRSGRYHLEEIEFDASYLKNGDNFITLKSMDGAFMYDTILLESDDQGSVFTNINMLKNYKMNGYINEEIYEKLVDVIEKRDFKRIDNMNLDDEFKEGLLRNLANMK